MDTKDKILKWVFECENTGSSSEAMAAHFAGLNITHRGKSYPLDPSDFNRCLTFLKWVPECRDRLHELKSISEKWESLIDRWEEIESCFIDEVGIDWSKGEELAAKKTYSLMKEVLS